LLFVSLFWCLERITFFSIFNHLLLLEKILILVNIGLLFYWLSVLIVISVYDLKKYLILNEVLFPAIILTFIWKVLEGILLSMSSFHFSFLPSLNHFLGSQNYLFGFHLSFLPSLNHFLGSQNYLFGYYSFFHSFFLGTIFFTGVIALLAFITHEKAMGWGDAILAIFLGMILGWPLAFITHEKAMGWGDAILALFLGMILGWPEALIALIIAFLSGGFISLILIALKKKTFHSYIPFAPFLTLGALTVMLFAPFLTLGALTVMLFGDIIIKAYLSLI